MTVSEKITYMDSLFAEEDKVSTEVLSSFLAMAEEIAIEKVFPFGCTDAKKAESILHRYDRTICRIAVFLINKRGAEGEKAHMESTAERTYENGDIPDSLMKKLIPYCGVL